MRFILDTHIVVWATAEPQRLSPALKTVITDPANDIFVSPVTPWEIAVESAVRRLVFPLDQLEDVLAAMGIQTLPITVAHAVAAGLLPRHLTDPFDRMLVAQAQLERLTLVTDDAALTCYDVPIFGRDAAPYFARES